MPPPNEDVGLFQYLLGKHRAVVVFIVNKHRHFVSGRRYKGAETFVHALGIRAKRFLSVHAGIMLCKYGNFHFKTLSSKYELTDKLRRELHALYAALSSPNSGVRLYAEVAVVTAGIKNCKQRPPVDVVHTRGRIVHFAPAGMHRALDVNVSDALSQSESSAR